MEFNLGVALGLGAAAAALLLPLLLAWVIRRRTGASLKFFAIGAGIFFVFQVILRLPWHTALRVALQDTLKGHAGLQLAWLAFSALTAGIFEETGRWAAYRFVVKQERSWRVGVMLGVGHGGIESILFVGISVAVSLVLYIQMAIGLPTFIPADRVPVVREQFERLTPALATLGGVERVFAMCVHVALSLVVMQVLTRGQGRWLLFAIAFHFSSNFFGILAVSRMGPFVGEGVIALFALTALVIIFRLRDRVAQAPI